MQPSPPTSHNFKLILCGSQGVGKTSLLHRYLTNTFKSQYFSTIGIDFKLHTLTLHSTHIKLQLWDTAGQQRFQSLTSIHFKGAHAVICVIDISNKESVKSCRYYLKEAVEGWGVERRNVWVVVNKCDVECMREVGQEEIERVGGEFGVTVRNCSAKSGEGVQEVFAEVVGRLVEGKGEMGEGKEGVELGGGKEEGGRKKCGC